MIDIYTISKIDINRYLHPKHKSNYALMLKSLSNSHVSLFAGGIPVLWQQKTPKTSSFACIFPCRNFIGSQSDYYLTVVILKLQWKLSNETPVSGQLHVRPLSQNSVLTPTPIQTLYLFIPVNGRGYFEGLWFGLFLCLLR